jgi:hypothetical protein
VIAFALAGLASACDARQDDSWAQIWSELEALRSGKISAAEASVLRGHLGDTLVQHADAPRAELLGLALAALTGSDASAAAARLATLAPSPFTARESWFLADLLLPGPERARLVLAALESQDPLADWQVLLAWNVAVDEARALRFETTALPIQLGLHERYRAAWSAEDLALTYRFLGRGQDAQTLLERAIDTERAAGQRAAGLLEKRGIQALGDGDGAAARDYLGQALALGSDDAGLVLARMDLFAGRNEEARRGFQAHILGQPPPDWAWRGWGTALLPPPCVPSCTIARPSANE